MMEKKRTYIAIDLKSFYASVECKERNRDPLTTNLVVADKSRTCIHASVEKDNVFACQFHPEKSSKWGLKILENFAAVGKDGNTEKEGK